MLFYNIIKPEKVREMTSESYIRGILDSFFELMEYHGIKKEVTGMVPPSGAYLSRILADYGIKYVSEPFRMMKCESEEKPIDIAIENGIITVDRTPNDLNNWDVHSIDYREVPEIEAYCFGSHWPNWLHEDAERNEEVIKSAIKYFYRCSEHQGNIISRDMKFSVTQTMFWKYAVLTENENGDTVVDSGGNVYVVGSDGKLTIVEKNDSSSVTETTSSSLHDPSNVDYVPEYDPILGDEVYGSAKQNPFKFTKFVVSKFAESFPR